MSPASAELCGSNALHLSAQPDCQWLVLSGTILANRLCFSLLSDRVTVEQVGMIGLSPEQ